MSQTAVVLAERHSARSPTPLRERSGHGVRPSKDAKARQSPVPLPATDLTRLYDWAAQPHAAVRCFARDVRRMPPMEGLGMTLGGLLLFRHLATPCLRAIVCGIVVGVTVKERKVIYEIDDGTAVLRVHVSGRGDEQLTEQDNIERRPRQSLQTLPTGVPSCYIRPPTPKRRKHQTSSTSVRPGPQSAAASWQPECRPRFHVGESVRASGRIRMDYGRDCTLSPGSLTLLDDPNEESRHFLEAIRLAETEYNLAMTPQRVLELTGPRPPPTSETAASYSNCAGKWDINARDADMYDGGPSSGPGPCVRTWRAGERVPHEDDTSSHRHLISPPTSQASAPNKKQSRRTDGFVAMSKRLQDARRLLSSQSETDELAEQYSVTRRSRDSAYATGHRAQRSRIHDAENSIVVLDSSDVEERAAPSPAQTTVEGVSVIRRSRPTQHAASSFARDTTSFSRQSSANSVLSSPGSRSRRLRRHQKLPDSKVTDSLFRLQVQKYLSDEFGASELCASRAFTVTDLMTQQDLVELARRLVRIKLASRATSKVSTKPNTVPRSSLEDAADKVKRLFHWTVRQMMTDGFILLTSTSAALMSRSVNSFCRPGGLRSNEQAEVVDLTSSPPGGTQAATGTVDAQREESYVLVTADVLVGPLLAVLRRDGRAGNGVDGCSTGAILQRLSRLDDGYSSLTCDSVEAALHELLRRGAVQRTSGGGWAAA